jgi:hypothetical protein
MFEVFVAAVLAATQKIKIHTEININSKWM